MKNLFAVFCFCLVAFTACGPAAEDRNVMHARAKVFQDSIANVIRMSMDEAAAPAPGAAPVMVAPGGQTMVTPGQAVPVNTTPPGQQQK